MSNSIAPLTVGEAMRQNFLTIPGFAWGMTTGAAEGTYRLTKGFLWEAAVVPGAIAGVLGAVGGTLLGIVSPVVPIFTQEIGANGPIDPTSAGPVDSQTGLPLDPEKKTVWTNATVYRDVRRNFVRE